MNGQKNLLHYLAEAYDRYRIEQHKPDQGQTSQRRRSWVRWIARQMVPNIGTLLAVVSLLWVTSAGAIPLRTPATATTSTGTIAYQGRLADSGGTPITDTVNMEFRLYDVAEGGAPLWSELWTGSNAVRVSDGLFNVMLGSLEPIPQEVVAGHDQLWLGITVGTDDEMTPRVQLGSVPFPVRGQRGGGGCRYVGGRGLSFRLRCPSAPAGSWGARSAPGVWASGWRGVLAGGTSSDDNARCALEVPPPALQRPYLGLGRSV